MIGCKDFILQVLIPLRLAWGYIYGYAGVLWTQALQDKIGKTTDSNRAASRKYGHQWIGRKVTDCSGLIRWALRQLGGDIPHHARYQYTDHCAKKGKLVGGRRDDGQPILPGTCVFLQGDQTKIHHVGVYVGSGVCVEAKGAFWGVVTSELSHWDHWGELKQVDYTGAAELEGAIEIPARGEGREPETVRAVVNNPQTWLNVRSGPSEKASRVFRVEKGSVVEVINQDEPGWWQIRFGGRIGWASAQHLQLMETEPADEPGDTDQGISVGPVIEAADPVIEAADPVIESADPVISEGDQNIAEDIIGELRGIREHVDRVIRMLGGEK